jgi:acetyl-CoA carboxylase biotin carboxyl carrier protein
VDLTNDDVADILALLDSLPYDALDLRTDRFRLTLRRTPAGWTEESELLAQPTDVTPALDAPDRPGGPDEAADAGRAVESGRVAGPGGIARAGGTAEPGEPAGRDRAAPGGLAEPDGFAGGDPRGVGASRLVAVVAPLPGTFYRAPRPGAPPFVEVGDAVGADTVVAIIETMKLMNSVLAGTPGRITRIVPDNGELVTLGAPLLLIDPNPDPSTAPDS